MTTTDETTTAPEPAPGQQQVQITLPEVPLPMKVFANPLALQDGRMIVFLTVRDPAGGQVQGYLVPEASQAIGRQLLELGREAALRKPLLVPQGAGGLVNVAGQPLVPPKAPSQSEGVKSTSESGGL
jgi:hypothetical protein